MPSGPWAATGTAGSRTRRSGACRSTTLDDGMRHAAPVVVEPPPVIVLPPTPQPQPPVLPEPPAPPRRLLLLLPPPRCPRAARTGGRGRDHHHGRSLLHHRGAIAGAVAGAYRARRRARVSGGNGPPDRADQRPTPGQEAALGELRGGANVRALCRSTSGTLHRASKRVRVMLLVEHRLTPPGSCRTSRS